MNFSLPEEDNFKITDNYYSIIKQISEDLIKYITNFKSYSNDYLKKYLQTTKNIIFKH